MHLTFFIGTLETGGAERQLAQLACGLAQRGHTVSLVTIYPGGQNWEWVQNCPSVRLQALYAKKASHMLLVGWQLAWAFWGLRHILRQEQPEVLYSALYLSNFMAWLASRNLDTVKLVWGIRASNLTLNWKRRVPFYLCQWVSVSVPLLIANSKVGLAYHEAKEYGGRQHLVISNGINTERFRPCPEEGSRVRQEWNISEQEILVGLVGRLDPMKDHPTFLRTVAQVIRERNDVRVVCVGNGPAAYRQELQALGRELGLTEQLIWAGSRSDMPAIYNALDIACSSSAYGEGFPNVIGEAMACGVPCVVTDVGDSAWIVGDTGIVVPPGDSELLAIGIQQLLTILKKDGQDKAIKVRERIETNFSLNKLVDSTDETLTNLVRPSRK